MSDSNGPGAGPQPGGAGGLFGSMPWGTTQDCMMCPLGLTMFAMRSAKPEVMEHLMKAGMELALAFKAFVDSATDRFTGQQPEDDGLQRIDIS
ncbi:MAG: hypothetical protein NVSMB57_03360 [Actinomycetota bacterium]